MTRTKGVEEQVHPLALVVGEGHLLELAIHQGSGGEGRGGLPDSDFGLEGHCGVVLNSKAKQRSLRSCGIGKRKKLLFRPNFRLA